MSFTNSPLVAYKRISPNRNSPRNHAIDTITIHCVVGQCSIETLGSIFATASKGASSNYGIGPDGRVGLYVEEKDRSWCSSNAANDNRAVTIEVASDTKEPYAVTDKAYAAIIELVTDICKRNGIQKLVWSMSKNDRVNHLNGCNLTVHRDFANKSCPGRYLYERHGKIADEVNKRLGTEKTETKPSEPETKPTVIYRVRRTWKDTAGQIGAFSQLENAKAVADKHPGYKVFDPGGNCIYPVETTPVKKTVDEIAREVISGKWGNGNDRVKKLKAAGYDYTAVQKRVNELMGKKSNMEIAKEVIAGKWGNGIERRERLTAAGYDFATIQDLVNRMM